jgi:hypothetical protein
VRSRKEPTMAAQPPAPTTTAFHPRSLAMLTLARMSSHPSDRGMRAFQPRSMSWS